MSRPRLSLAALTKSFGGITALRGVTFDVAPGSVHALLGENGAGKSTIVKIVSGMLLPDSGKIELDGEAIAFASPMEARASGVVAVYQDPKLFPHLDIAENIFMGHHPRGAGGLIARRRMYDRASALIQDLGVHLDVTRPVLGLSIGETQYVELARALAVGEMRLLFLDEPTAALTPAEADMLFALVRRLRDKGTSVVFISHRLEEIRDLVDTVTVLRDGQHVQTLPAADITQRDIVKAMVGRDLGELYAREETASARVAGEVRLAVSGLTATGLFSGVSFEVRAGEVVGMAGLVGAGRSEIALGIMGLIPTRNGEVSVDGVVIDPRTARRMRRHGVAFVPEDRDLVGLIASHSMKSNLSLAVLGSISRAGFIKRRTEQGKADELVRQLQIKVGSIEDAASTLSGGNRQKVVIGKWLARDPGVFILDEPTHGIDVGTKANIHRLIANLAAKGAAIVIISSDLPEVLGICDRVLVVRHGRIAAALGRGEATEELVMSVATGGGLAA